MTAKNVRVRFAPSPTGTLHVGGARTALFNWLFARAQKGTFILRIEDTDQKRYEKSAEEAMIKDLEWLGLNWDEGPDKGGPCEPYRQSLRLKIYHEHAEKLISNGDAYHCFCTPDRLDQVRKEQKEKKLRPGYDGHCRNLSQDAVKEKLEQGCRHVIRLKVPESGTTRFDDYLRGEIEYQNQELDDLILIKSDGFPSYHLANVVDDHLMEITHVLRGDEWIPSTPKHVLIYRSFGWESPVFVHLPVILAEGGGKLSKRKGASSVTDYKDLGYLPDCLNNFLSLLGWSPGDDREIMTRDALQQAFSLDRINPKSCAFDEKKLQWMNSQYIAAMSEGELLEEVKTLWKGEGLDLSAHDENGLLKIIGMLKDRCKKIPDFAATGAYFFSDPQEYHRKARKKHFKEGVDTVLQNLRKELEKLDDFTAAGIEELYRRLAEEQEMPNAAPLIHPTRLAVSGLAGGPGLFEIMEMLSRDTVLRRLETAAEFIKSNAD